MKLEKYIQNPKESLKCYTLLRNLFKPIKLPRRTLVLNHTRSAHDKPKSPPTSTVFLQSILRAPKTKPCEEKRARALRQLERTAYFVAFSRVFCLNTPSLASHTTATSTTKTRSGVSMTRSGFNLVPSLVVKRGSSRTLTCGFFLRTRRATWVAMKLWRSVRTKCTDLHSWRI